MGSFILSFCCIDYMGAAFSTREKNTRKHFKQFVKQYMGAINEKYQGLANDIYAIRNSLVHSYGQSDTTEKLNIQPSFSHMHPELHLKTNIVDDKKIININLPEFIGELVAAIEKFFREKIGLNDNSVIWYLKLFSIQNVEVTTLRQSMLYDTIPPHSKLHPSLKILEENPPADLANINLTIQNFIR